MHNVARFRLRALQKLDKKLSPKKRRKGEIIKRMGKNTLFSMFARYFCKFRKMISMHMPDS